MKIDMKLLSSLDKVFLDEEPVEQSSKEIPQGFQNEVLSFQAAYTVKETAESVCLHVTVDSPIADYVTVRQVYHVPVRMPTYPDSDDCYLRKTPGLYPDLLRSTEDYHLRACINEWYSLWIEFRPDGKLSAGIYPITVRIMDEQNKSLCERTQHVEILPGCLPEQRLIHTKWLHCDCLAQYYRVETFGEDHWRIIENFVKKAVDAGINMIMMPLHTFALDTREGGERPTTQLVEITKENGTYRFDMSQVRWWIAMCKSCGVKYYEIPHLFTQWGAKHAPKIMAKVNGVSKRIFGWDTDAAGEEYGKFLKAYIPALLEVFREEGIDKETFWHISDEPVSAHLESYMAAKKQIGDLLKGYRIIDATRNIELYLSGAIEHPVTATTHTEPFLEAKVPGLWVYYCCAEYKDVSNMFLTMPSARNRILGVQLFKYSIEGFLQWGFNFYNSQYSDYPIDPYATVDGDGWVPAGDPFQVYPGREGMPEESIRLAVTREALQDLRAFEWLSDIIGRENVVRMIEEELPEKVTFTQYPHDQSYLFALRRKVNQAILDATLL